MSGAAHNPIRYLIEEKSAALDRARQLLADLLAEEQRLRLLSAAARNAPFGSPQRVEALAEFNEAGGNNRIAQVEREIRGARSSIEALSREIAQLEVDAAALDATAAENIRNGAPPGAAYEAAAQELRTKAATRTALKWVAIGLALVVAGVIAWRVYKRASR